MDEYLERLKLAVAQPGKFSRTPVSVNRIDLIILINAYERIERAIRAKIWNKIQRIEVNSAKEIDAPKSSDTKFFVVFVNEKMDFAWYEKSEVHKFSDGAFFIRDVWGWELESSGLTVVREDGVFGELLRPVRESRF